VVDVLDLNLYLERRTENEKAQEKPNRCADLGLHTQLSSCGSSFDYDKERCPKCAASYRKSKQWRLPGIFDRMHETVQSLVSVETLRDSWDPILSSSGAFIAYEKNDNHRRYQDGINYIVVIVPCEYEKKHSGICIHLYGRL
jgi:hypothetical protein